MDDLVNAAQRHFALEYRDARERFLDACARAGVEPRTYENPLQGPHGETLATDAAWLGPDDAARVMVLVSATHGVEGFPGSAAQIDWLEAGGEASLPAGVAALVVHAINPYGFAWQRRVTEEGVDLNRNFVDFSAALPENPGYDELADALVPPALDERTLADADARIEAYGARHGVAFEVLALSRHERLLDLARRLGATATERVVGDGTGLPAADQRLADRELVGVVDFHTGLGPFGYGEPICAHTPDTPNVARAYRWYGRSVTQPALGTSSSVEKTGLAEFGWEAMLGERVTFVAVEYGTYPPANVRRVLRQDHWLHAHRNVDWNDEQTRRIKSDIRLHFAPRSVDWQEMVLFRARQIVRQGLAALGGAPEAVLDEDAG